MSYAVLLAGSNDSRGRPEGYPIESELLSEGDICPPGYVEMSEEDLISLKSSFSDQIQAWQEQQSLARFRARTIERLKGSITKFIESRYSDAQQRSLLMLYQEAQAAGYTNRQQLIQSVIDWIKSALTDYYTKRALVEAAGSVSDIDAVELDLQSLIDSDPQVSLEQVYILNN